MEYLRIEDAAVEHRRFQGIGNGDGQMVEPGSVQREQPLLSGTAGDEQKTSGKSGGTGEPLAAADGRMARSFAK